MTELDRFAAALLHQWRNDGGADGGPISVSALVDRVFPYRVARRILGIDVSEDYEALLLRLISEEDQLVTTEPLDAADMAKATMSSKLPDLEVLQLLRGATVTVTRQTIARLDGVLPMPQPRDGPAAAEAAESAAPPATSTPVIPLHPEPAPTPPPSAAETYLTSVTFAPPEAKSCWRCEVTLPEGREFKFCPFCGADQRALACRSCGAPLERGWKHCPECGTTAG